MTIARKYPILVDLLRKRIIMLRSPGLKVIYLPLLAQVLLLLLMKSKISDL